MPAGASRRLAEDCLDWIAAEPPRPDLPAQRSRLDSLGRALAGTLQDTDDRFTTQLIVAFSGLQLFELPEPWLDTACAAVDRCPDPLLRCAGQSALSWHLLQAGLGPQARQHAEAGLAGLPAGHLALRSQALQHAVRQRWLDDEPVDALWPLLDEAEAAARGVADWGGLARACALRCAIAGSADLSMEALRRLHEQTLEATRLWGDRDAACSALYGLAALELARGELPAAAALLPAVVGEARALGHERLLAQATHATSEVLSRQHRWPEALAAARETLALAPRIGLHRTTTATLLWQVPRILARLGRGADALRVLCFGEALRERSGPAMSADEQEQLRQLRRLAASRVPPGEHGRCRTEGLALTEAQAVALVFAD